MTKQKLLGYLILILNWLWTKIVKSFLVNFTLDFKINLINFMSNKANNANNYGEDTIALEVVKGINLTDYEIVITGANSSIGVETLRALAKAGARCVLCCRDVEKAK